MPEVPRGWKRTEKPVHAGQILSLVLCLLAFAPEQWMERMNTIGSAEDDASFMSRVSSWKLNTILALDRPLLGGGYSALENWAVFDIYRYKFHMLDDLVYSPEPNIAFAAHSIYFETLGDLGFPGFFLFMAILFTGFRNISRILRLARASPSLGWASDLAVLFRLSLVVFMVSGALLSAAYFELLYIMLTQVSVLRRHLEETAVLRGSEGKQARPGALPLDPPSRAARLQRDDREVPGPHCF